MSNSPMAGNNAKQMDNSCLLCNSIKVYEVFCFQRVRIVKCEQCGLLYQDQSTMQEDLSKIYDNIYEEYSSENNNDGMTSQPKSKPWADSILNEVGRYHPESGRMLDVGCSYGNRMAVFEEAGWTVYGIDLSEPAIRSASAAGLNCEYCAMEEYNPPHKFEVIVMSHVLEHCRNPVSALNRVKDWLSPEGTVHIRVPNAGSCLFKMHPWLLKGDIKPFEHLFYFTADTLASAIKVAGLDCDIRTEGRFTLASLINLILRMNLVTRDRWQKTNYFTGSNEKRKYLRFRRYYEKILRSLNSIHFGKPDREICAVARRKAIG